MVDLMTSAADRNLAPEQFPELNKEFYSADPEDYLDRRGIALMMAISNSPAIRDAAAEGLSYGTLAVNGSPGEAEGDDNAIDRYASLESTNLLHHAGECMLRLYFAHSGLPPCPWLEVARLRSPRAFKERTEALLQSLDEQATIDDLVITFLGNTDPKRLGLTATPEEWQGLIDGLVMLVGHIGSVLLDQASLYNATKHGLAVVGGHHGLSLGPAMEDAHAAEEAEPVISASGPALAYLDLTDPDPTTPRQWTKKLTFVPIESNIALTKIISKYVGSLWKIAKYRYTGTSTTPFSLPGFDRAALYRVISTGRDEPIVITTMTVQLLYYADEPDDHADAST